MINNLKIIYKIYLKNLIFKINKIIIKHKKILMNNYSNKSNINQILINK